MQFTSSELLNVHDLSYKTEDARFQQLSSSELLNID